MAADSDNLFAPPRADLGGAPEEEARELVLATPLQRLLACIVGVALGWAFMTASEIAGQIIAENVGIGATLTVWDPMHYAAGGVFLVVYLPFALHRLARGAQTLPLRFLGLRFARADGTRPGVWRILLLHGLPTVLVFWGPALAAESIRFIGPLGALIRFGGLLLLCANALSARRAGGVTWLDRLTGLRVVKA